MENVAGKIVVITGASSGLGAETARHLVDAGAKVALGARKKSGEVEIYVADNGPGVPAEDRHKVLERFYRMESARTEPGSGLGLALVAAVADMHQGRLELTDGTPNDTGVGLRVSLIFRAA